ncbi:MAG: molybdopterin-dependent oxidoreductase, partial [Verrucomicrobia bacterium]|nr:molybdopterin-dependent oxidoreductase [Verrucomicrobiota bacterium]
EFAAFVREFTPDKAAAETGLTVGEIVRFAETIQRGAAVSFWWTMGVNQSHQSTRTAQAIINLALMTGNIGRPGTGANSLTGQCNAMGSRLFSNITSLIGGRDFLNPAHRQQVARELDIPAERIPAQNSWAYDQILEGIRAGRIRALWVIATNPAHSWIGRGPGGGGTSQAQDRPDEPAPPGFDEMLDQLDFLVVQDMFPTTDTARRADLYLPAAGWGEKEGTFINSERRIGLTRKVARAPGLALSDFNIFRLVAQYWGCGELFTRWNSPAAAFQILKRLSAGQPCDITGIRDYDHLEAEGGIQWPRPQMRNPERGVRKDGTAPDGGSECRRPRGAAGDLNSAFRVPPSAFKEFRLFTDGRFFTADGKARFVFDRPRPVPEPTDDEFPLVLLTGRGTSAQWHTNTRTEKSAVLRSLYPANPYVEVHPSDAARLRVAMNSRVAVVSRRGRVECAAFVTPTVPPGQVFLPMHYAVTNQLTRADFDPHSRQPSYKHCAVRLEPLSG